MTTGAELAERIHQAALAAGVSLSKFALPLAANPRSWLHNLARAERPTPRTIARIEALLSGSLVSPPATHTRVSAHRATLFPAEQRQPREYPDPIDRDPCFLCGVRADIGCRHRQGAR